MSGQTRRSLSQRLAWFVLLYIGGVLTMGIVALLFRILLLNTVR